MIDTIDIALEACINGHPDLAEDLLRQRDPNDVRVRFNLGWHELRHGRFLDGMRMLDAGRYVPCYGSPPIPGVIWNPKEHDLQGRTILLRSEGGYGDEMVNARFAANLAEHGAKVILACHPSLMSLLARVKGVSAAISSGVVTECYYDYWLPAMSAPHVLGLEFPDHTDTAAPKLSGAPYLTAHPALAAKWKGLLKDGYKVGIRWRGSPKFEHHQYRTFDPEPLFSLAEIDGVRVFSLQRDEGSELLPQDSDVIDLGLFLTSWEETAAAISNLDLVVTSCTAIGHLAAALGVPTFVVVPCMPYYIWAYSTKRDGTAFGGDTSPWHDTVRLFRQTKFGEWNKPLLAMNHAVRDLVAPTWRAAIMKHGMVTCDGGLA